MGLFDGLSVFGYTFVKNKGNNSGSKTGNKLLSVDYENDASEIIDSNDMGGAYGYALETVTAPASERETIRTYRSMARSAKIDLVLNEIRNEIFIFDIPSKKAVDISFPEDCKTISKSIQNKIHEAYDEVYRVLDFRNRGLELFDSWYIDSRLFLHKVVDENNKKMGIKQVIKIDPLKIKKIREVPLRDDRGLIDYSKIKEYYIYVNRTDTDDNQKTASRSFTNTVGLKLTKESIAYCDSGIIVDGVVLGHLDKAIIPYNNLKMMEVSLLIYRVSRAPERRIIYVDVGNLPKNKAEQYVRDLMNKFKNKLVYDSKTGALADKKNVLSMMEDYWLPRREGKSTEISTLPGGENLGITADVEYFANELNNALNVPYSRFSDQAPTFMFGKGQEINRDEYRFKKFIDRIRNKFVTIFEDLLKTQLMLKGVIVEDDWEDIKENLIWVYAEDNNFVEYKEAEVLNSKMATLQMVDPFVGKYLSIEWVNNNILKLSDEERDKNDAAMEKEKERMNAMADNGEDNNGSNSQGTPSEDDNAQQDNNNQTTSEEDNGPPFM